MRAETLYVVMRAIAWQGIEVGGSTLASPPDGPQRFIPVFDTQEQAIAWAEDGDVVAPIRLAAPTPAQITTAMNTLTITLTP